MIKVYNSTQTGAPVLSGVASALRTLLKTCLVDGFGAGAVATLTVDSGIATATYGSGHPFKVGSVSLFSGATPSGLNGEKRILTTTSGAVTFAAPGVADGAATGTITSKMAAAGWAEVFTGTNLSALKPTAVEATGCVLRIDDTGTTNARVRAFESMSDINTGAGPTPLDAQAAGGAYWPKSNAADATARRWILWADGQSIVLWVAPHVTYQTHGVVMGFGDLISDKSGDAYGCIVTDALSTAPTSSSVVPGCLGYGHATSAGVDAYVMRAFTGVGGSQVVKKVAAHNTGAGYAGLATYNGNNLPYPNGADNSLRLASVEVLVGTSGFRGRVAGVYHSPQLLGSSFSSGDTVPGQGAFAGRSMMAVRVGPPASALASAGTLFIDLTGPWRV